MSEKTVLTIDDSTTIRRLCDKELSAAGYRVLVSETAEDGVAKAIAERPDLIILDHQLPGKSGYEVAVELLMQPETATIPVVASSTLRKKAYVEYVDCDNVVDMLPKPYTPEALIATVENAINTGVMVVNSQASGSAVPEVIDPIGDSELSGSLDCFRLREILDLLNHGKRKGMLTVEKSDCRVNIYIDRGRIQAVTAQGLDPEVVANLMPESLAELAPVVKLTVAGRGGSEIAGLLGLLDSNVMDPRLLKKVLRIQAAILIRQCFAVEGGSFRFEKAAEAPGLFQKLPLESSLLSLVVEGSLTGDYSDLPEIEPGDGYVRKAIRGQILDRAGLSNRHMKLLNSVSEPTGVAEIAAKLGWAEEEVVRVARGFELAELIEVVSIAGKTRVFGVLSDSEQATKVREFYRETLTEVLGKIVRDAEGLKLLMRRTRPDVLLLQVDEETQTLLEECAELLEDVRVIGIGTAEGDSTHEKIARFLGSDCSVDSIREAVLAESTSTDVVEG